MSDPFTLARKGIMDGEGCRLRAYADPKTRGPPWTIGWGCTGQGIGPDTIWTQDHADLERDKRLQQAMAQLDHALPWWRTKLNTARQAVFIELAYNLGGAGLLKFKRMLAAAEAGAFKVAAMELLHSQWAEDVKATRANRLADQLRSGVSPFDPPPAP